MALLQVKISIIIN